MTRLIDRCVVMLVLVLAGNWLACSDDGPTAPALLQAKAVINPTTGNQAQGTVEFKEESGGVRVIASLTGVSEGMHGFHIHETGDCSAGDGSSAGGHYNPEGVQHGAPDDAIRHVGDLGNVTANTAGQATYNRVDTRIKLSGGHNIIGRAVIIHALPDDFSQPTGAAGARIGCGVIEAN